MTPEQLGLKECNRCHCLRPAKALDDAGRCTDWPLCQEKVNGSAGPQTGELHERPE